MQGPSYLWYGGYDAEIWGKHVILPCSQLIMISGFLMVCFRCFGYPWNHGKVMEGQSAGKIGFLTSGKKIIKGILVNLLWKFLYRSGKARSR